MRLKIFNNNIFDENAYLVTFKDYSILIDPGFNFDDISLYIKEHNLNLTKILLTHGHIDHLGDLDKFVGEYKDLKVYIHEDDAEMLKDSKKNASYDFGIAKTYDIKNLVLTHDKDEIDNITFIHTKGHSKGSQIIKIENCLFTGDTLFNGSIGRTDLYGGSSIDIYKSLDMLISKFSNSLIIYPGHYQKSTLKEEILNNPFLNRR